MKSNASPEDQKARTKITVMNIEELNGEIRRCGKCRLTETRANVLCGEGNLNAELMLIAQAPGENEDREGKMFIGPSGRVLDELLTTTHVTREKIYMTNLVKCMLPKCRRPKRDEIEICSKYLDKEIEVINPRVLVPLGYYATRHVFEKNIISLPAKPGFLKVYGRLFWTGARKILPLPHPAAVLYDSAIKGKMIEKYGKMKILLTECKWYPSCPLKNFYDEEKLSEEWIELYCKGDWESCVRYQMEERGEPHPDWMLPDGNIDERLHKSFRR